MPFPSTVLFPGSATFPDTPTVTAAYQGYFNGLQFGPGSDVQIVNIDGLRAIPALRTGDVPVPRRDGMSAGLNFLAERVVTIQFLVSVTKTDPYEVVLQNVSDAFQNIQDPDKQLPLQFLAPGWLNPRQLMCRPTKGSLPIDVDYSYHKASPMVELTASDPLIYDTVQQSVSVGLPSPTAGLMFPVLFPVTFGASTGGSMQVTNTGNYITAPVFTITGPVQNPSVSLTSTGQFMKLNISLGANDVLVVDMGRRLVTLNGTAARFNTVATGSSWFGFPPGTSSVGVASSDSTQVTAQFTAVWRSAWGWA